MLNSSALQKINERQRPLKVLLVLLLLYMAPDTPSMLKVEGMNLLAP